MTDSAKGFEELTAQLGRWDERRRMADALLWLPRGLLAGLLVAGIVAALARFRPMLSNEEVTYVTVALALSGFLTTLFILLLLRRSLTQKARFADRQFGLLERASTAIEIRGGLLQTDPALAEQQLKDTLRATARVDTRNALRLRINWPDLAIIFLAIALLTAAVLTPNPQAEALEQSRAISRAITDQIEALEELQSEIQQSAPLNEGQMEELLEPIQGALQELRAGNLSQEQAVAVLSEAEADLRELSEANSVEALRQKLQEAGQPLTDNPVSQTLGQALQNGDLAAAGSAASQLADSIPELSPDDLRALAEDLAEAASALQDLDPKLAAELARAAQALRDENVNAAEGAIREAAATLQQRAQQQAASQRSASAAEQLNESREEVAQAGQPAPEGQQGLAQGQQGGIQSDNQGQGQGSNMEQGEGTGGPGPGGGHAESVYVPAAADLGGEPGVEIELPAECIADPDSCGALLSETTTEFADEESMVPYDQVFGDYRDAAYQALDNDHIPLGLKGFVRDYFSSLEP